MKGVIERLEAMRAPDPMTTDSQGQTGKIYGWNTCLERCIAIVRQHEAERQTGDIIKRVHTAICQSSNLSLGRKVARAAIAAMGDASTRKDEGLTGQQFALSPTSPARSEISVNGSVAGAQKSCSASPAYRGHDLGTPASYAGGNTERHGIGPSDSMFTAPHQLGDAPNTAPPAPAIPEEEWIEAKLMEHSRYVAEPLTGNERQLIRDMFTLLRPYLRSQPARPVSLIDCAMALQGNERIKLGADLQVIAKAILDAAGVAHVED